ncbi:MAG: DUF58 domain-containing protein [bacterium]
MVINNKINYKKYLQPEFISRLAGLDIIARLVVEGFITGLHRSPYHGFSVEFSEYRPYMPGDSVRNIDWKVLGRTERYYVKQFEEETNLRAYLLMDSSGSMGYTSTNITKLQYARYLGAALTYLLLKQRDAAGLVTFSDQIQSYLPPRSVFSYLNQILIEMDSLKAEGKTRIADTFHILAEKIKKRGLIIILSDLFDDPDDILTALKHFRHRKHEIIVFHILDPMETQFSFDNDTVFIDMETQAKIQTLPKHIQGDYRHQIKQFLKKFKKECFHHKIDYYPVHTSKPFDESLYHYLVKRKKIGG